MKLRDILLEFLLEGDNRIEVMRSKFVDSGKVTSEIFDELLSIDPTTNKKYSQWVINQYMKIQSDRNEAELFMEDSYKLKEYLDIFERHKNKFELKDINQYKNYRDFFRAAVVIKNTLGNEAPDGEFYNDPQIQKLKLGTVEGFDVYKIPKGATNMHAISRKLGHGTEWCTAYESPDNFIKYIRQGALYIFLKPGGKEAYQFNFETDDFKDINDGDIF